MLFELRQYRAVPGKRDELVELMETRIIPAQVAAGIAVVGSFVAEEDDDLYVWIRRFDSEEARERDYERFYGSAVWTDELRPAVHEVLDRESMQITRLIPTASSPLH